MTKAQLGAFRERIDTYVVVAKYTATKMTV